MERAENTARMVNVNSNLLFDLPRGTKISWSTLVDTIGSNAAFSEHYSNFEERSVIKFLLSDSTSPSSIFSSLRHARENARTTREILPSEAWECINELYLYVKDEAATNLARKDRYYLLQEVIIGAQHLVGLLSGTMSHNHAYDFIRMGICLERADMTSRVIDMGRGKPLPDLLDDAKDYQTSDPYESILWMNILVSLGAHQSFRQKLQNRVNGQSVVRYLLTDTEFPRAILFCIDELYRSIVRLPRSSDIAIHLDKIKTMVIKADIDKLYDDGLHKFLDDLQIEFGKVSEAIEQNWFLA